jgi:hypothetical protein
VGIGNSFFRSVYRQSTIFFDPLYTYPLIFQICKSAKRGNPLKFWKSANPLTHSLKNPNLRKSILQVAEPPIYPIRSFFSVGFGQLPPKKSDPVPLIDPTSGKTNSDYEYNLTPLDWYWQKGQLQIHCNEICLTDKNFLLGFEGIASRDFQPSELFILQIRGLGRWY